MISYATKDLRNPSPTEVDGERAPDKAVCGFQEDRRRSAGARCETFRADPYQKFGSRALYYRGGFR
jgi:hypothetical protein